MGKQRVEEIVWDLAAPLARDLGLSLVEVKYVKVGADWRLEVVIEKENPEAALSGESAAALDGVTVEDCQRLSEALSRRLDEVDPIPHPYLLEVASPGLERPVKVGEFPRFLGRLLAVSTFSPVAGRKEWEGRLVAQEGEEIILATRKQEIRIPLAAIAKAHLVAEI